VKEEVPDEPPPTQQQQQQTNTGTETTQGPTEAPPAPPETPVEPPKPKVEENFEFAQELPKPIIDLNTFFAKNIKYPDLAIETGIQGKVNVKFVVKADGTIDKSTIQLAHGLKNGGAGLNDEAIRVVKLIPEKGSFTPGNNNGVPVNVWISIPVKFTLNND
jgi:protein TonB